MSKHLWWCVLSVGAVSAGSMVASAQCGSWVPGFGVPGMSGSGVNTAAAWDPDGAGPQPPSVIIEQRAALENSINRIESGFARAPASPLPAQPAAQRPAPQAPPAPPPAAARPASPPQPSQPKPASAAPQANNPAPHRRPPVTAPRPSQGSQPRSEPTFAGQSAEPLLPPMPVQRSRPSAPADPIPSLDADLPMMDDAVYAPESEYDISADARAGLDRRRPLLRLAIVLALVLGVLGGIGWLTYTAVDMLLSTGERAAQAPGAGEAGAEALDPASVYLTILSPQDTGALQTNGRGRAEIINEGNVDMIRLVSVRPGDSPAKPADPILLAIPEGVLAQVAGKNVKVEIKAKSGKDDQASFAIGCDFAGSTDACKRKRFQVGTQPNYAIFEVDFPADAANGGAYFLAISTDITSDAEATAEGDPIDIIQARLRFPKP
jgi:hypothetical protein